MTVESSAQINSSHANTEPPELSRCKHPRCQCPPLKGKGYCSSCCEENSDTATYCTCTHEGCYRECDLVMKGGITSGIVYPPLVYKLYENNYRFRNIGGTSAGAIMAAFTAAAEYGRAVGGFEKLHDIKERLGKDDFLRNLFQPSKETRPLFKFLESYTEVTKGKAKREGWFWEIWELAGKLQRASTMRFLSTYLLGMLAGLGVASVLIWAAHGVFNSNRSMAVLFVFGLLGAFAGYVVAFGIGGYKLVNILIRKIPDNHFGMCTGLKDDSVNKKQKDASRPKEREALTNWMNDSINELAGIKGPLTFGMLKEKKFVKQQEAEDGINLRMMTSNVSQNQPYVLPFTDQFLLYNEDEFRKFFPKEVIVYMKDHAPKKPAYDLSRIPGYFFLPAAKDLPVIVATRLSLSFPLLLCALPLYTIVPDKMVTDESMPSVIVEKHHLKLNWFSDGGIASNFPLQFFDSWLPTRPTFGVNLTSLPAEERPFKKVKKPKKEGLMGRLSSEPDELEVDDNFISPMANPSSQKAREVTGTLPAETADKAINKKPIYLPAADAPLFTEWTPLTKKSAKRGEEIPNLLKFLWSIFTTAQNYRDNMQAMLPSYRERIVQIRLRDDEGGLNLAMKDETIKNLMKKGGEAGDLLVNEFDFKVHQWVRFQVLMIQMERYLKKTEEVAREDEETKARQFDYLALLKAQAENKYPYGQEDAWCTNAAIRMNAMGEFIKAWGEFELGKKPPLPESVLRVTPEI
jgi:predicted acylesterase/phospholipase RssA